MAVVCNPIRMCRWSSLDMCIPNKTHSFTHSILLFIKYMGGGLRFRELRLKTLFSFQSVEQDIM